MKNGQVRFLGEREGDESRDERKKTEQREKAGIGKKTIIVINASQNEA